MRFLLSIRHALDQLSGPLAALVVYLLCVGAAATLVLLAVVAVVVCL